MNFVVCSDDGARLKADPRRIDPAKPLLLRCPQCGQRFRLVNGHPVKTDQDSGA